LQLYELSVYIAYSFYKLLIEELIIVHNLSMNYSNRLSLYYDIAHFYVLFIQ